MGLPGYVHFESYDSAPSLLDCKHIQQKENLPFLDFQTCHTWGQVSDGVLLGSQDSLPGLLGLENDEETWDKYKLIVVLSWIHK
jgi:hypothetical protein